MDVSKTKAYRTIVASTTAFGGAQLLNAVVNAVRGKFVAALLGTAGQGVSSLLSNASSTLQQFATLGINVSVVRNISQANDAANPHALARAVGILRSLMLGAAGLGTLLTLALSPLIAHSLFGHTRYLPHILLMSAAVAFSILASGESALLQGLRRYKQIAVCSTVAPLCGLLLGVPLYYLMDVDGIVPAMILITAAYYCALRHCALRATRRLPAVPRASLTTVWREGRSIVHLGIVMTVAALIGSVATYSLSAFIRHFGSLFDVGIYNAANSITSQYIGLVFGAMAADYYPHLSALLGKDKAEAHRLVNQQTEIVLLVVVPLAMLVILTAPVLISVLLTAEYQPCRDIIRFMGFSAIFRGLCFPMDYIALSKGDKKFFFWVEGVWGNAKTLAVFTAFYYTLGLDGLGYAALCSALIDVATSVTLNRWRYGFTLAAPCLRLLAVLMAMAVCALAASFVPSAPWGYALMGASTLLCCAFSLWQLNRRIDLHSLVAGRLKKRAAQGHGRQAGK